MIFLSCSFLSLAWMSSSLAQEDSYMEQEESSTFDEGVGEQEGSSDEETGGPWLLEEEGGEEVFVEEPEYEITVGEGEEIGGELLEGGAVAETVTEREIEQPQKEQKGESQTHKEAEQPKPARKEKAPQSLEKVWIDDSVPEESQTGGFWIWDEKIKFSGKVSHTESARPGLHQHWFKSKDPIIISEGSIIIQHVYLDPQDTPKGIMLKFWLENGKEVGVYWESEEETFVIGLDEPVWYYGDLPKVGEWKALKIYAEDLLIEGKGLLGISFFNMNGKVYWDRTIIKQGRFQSLRRNGSESK